MKKAVSVFGCMFLLLMWSGMVFCQEVADQGADAAQIIEKTIQTMYPVEKAEKVKGKSLARYLFEPNGSLFCYARTEFILPDTLEETIYFSADKRTDKRTYRDGKAAYLINKEDSSDEAALNKIKEYAELVESKLFPLLHHQKLNHKCVFTGEEEVEGKPCYVVEFTDENGLKDRFFIDKQSYLVLKRVSEYSENGGKSIVVGIFGDYRQVDGMQQSFLSRDYDSEGTLQWTVETDSVKFLY